MSQSRKNIKNRRNFFFSIHFFIVHMMFFCIKLFFSDSDFFTWSQFVMLFFEQGKNKLLPEFRNKSAWSMFFLNYRNQCVMWLVWPPCLQVWHHVNQLLNSVSLPSSSPLLELPVVICSPLTVPMCMRQIAQRGRGFRQLGQEDI